MKIMKPLSMTLICAWLLSGSTQCLAQKARVAVVAEEPTVSSSEVPDRFWRDAECGFWIFSATATLPDGFCIWSATIEHLAPVQFLLPGCESTLTHISRIRLLCEQKIPSASEIDLLCRILYRLIWKENWSLFAASDLPTLDTPKCKDHFQNAALYNEALLRLVRQYPSTTIRDISIQFTSYDVYWY